MCIRDRVQIVLKVFFISVVVIPEWVEMMAPTGKNNFKSSKTTPLTMLFVFIINVMNCYYVDARNMVSNITLEQKMREDVDLSQVSFKLLLS